MLATGVQLFADVSQYSGKIDFNAYRVAGHRILGYKISEGRTFLDPTALANRDGCLASGTRGLAYHYLYGSDEYYNDASLWAEQAHFFLKYAPVKHAHCLDVEMLAPAGRYLHVREWVNAYRDALPNHPLLIYSNYGLWVNRSRVPYDAPVGTLLWHAGYKNGMYTSAAGTLEQQWASISGCTNSMITLGYPNDPPLWQYTDHAKVPGVPNACDGNAFMGSLAEWDTQLVNGVEDEMPTVDEISHAVWASAWREYFDENGNGVRDSRSASDFLVDAHSQAVQAKRGVDAVTQDVADLSAQVAALAATLARIEADVKPASA